tara:strand:- start:117 stop:302 length:186 start_codon:yes stop_codon:yes gene_type:complete
VVEELGCQATLLKWYHKAALEAAVEEILVRWQDNLVRQTLAVELVAEAMADIVLQLADLVL